MFEIGNSLREARTRRGVEFAQAEQATKIRGKYLRALEDERFELLPSETYVKGFLRTYAEYLGLDGQLYVDEFNSRFVAGDELDPLRPRRTRRQPPPRARRFERNVVLGALVAIAVVTVVVIGAWKSSGGDGKAPPAKGERAAAAPNGKQTHPAPYLTIAGVHGPSLVLVRQGDATGKVLFQGTIAKGDRIPFRGKRFWLNVGAPENLVIKVGGTRVRIDGYRPRVIIVTPQGWQAG